MQQLSDQLGKLISAGKLPQAILLSGQNADMLLEQACLAARQILRTENLNISPDFICASSGSVEDLRRLLSVIQLKSFDRRVVILHGAEELSPQAVNSLLKKIEEPDYNTFFILTTIHESKLLPTLRSRLTIFRDAVTVAHWTNDLAESFYNSSEITQRIALVKNFDAHNDDLNSFLQHLYKKQIKGSVTDQAKRLPLLLRVYELVEGNVGANRALQWLAIKW